jgi:hypothetical protein
MGLSPFQSGTIAADKKNQQRGIAIPMMMLIAAPRKATNERRLIKMGSANSTGGSQKTRTLGAKRLVRFIN